MLWTFAALVALTAAAYACPVCDSDAGAKLREAIFNEDLLPTTVLVLTPIVLLALLLMSIYRMSHLMFSGEVA
jgi:hypothetical protein